MKRQYLTFWISLICTALWCISNGHAQPVVGKWYRINIAFENRSWSGNPFEIKIDGIFRHTESNEEIKLPGYYAGGDQWILGFMPTRIGKWLYVTNSSDPELDGINGSLYCKPSKLPGMLTADKNKPKKWKYTDGPYVIPIALRMEIFYEKAPMEKFIHAANFLKDRVNGHIFETRLTDEMGWYDGRTDYIFKGNWKRHEFDLDVWDQMEQRLTVLTERGLGAHVMFYSDDKGKPAWKGKSETEALLIRYAIARLAGFPVVWFNTGIDIKEYRSEDDINWFGEQLKELDPYKHPISSRTGGGSGNVKMRMRSFDSQGFPKAKIQEMIKYYRKSGVPVSMDDGWGENRKSFVFKFHNENDIRRAFWKCVMAGGIGGLVRGGGDGLPDDGYFSIITVQKDLESEQWLKLINPFIQNEIGNDFGFMEPSSDIVSKAHGMVNTLKTKILIYYVGKNDRYDKSPKAYFLLNLKDLNGRFRGIWYDPRSGRNKMTEIYNGGREYKVFPPNEDDWVMLIRKDVK